MKNVKEKLFAILASSCSSASTSTGYSSGSSVDGSSTILSAFSSRSNSSLSERSKTSPTSFKPIIPLKYQITTDEDFTYKPSILADQEHTNSNHLSINCHRNCNREV